jgi:hypothetical protein
LNQLFEVFHTHGDNSALAVTLMEHDVVVLILWHFTQDLVHAAEILYGFALYIEWFGEAQIDTLIVFVLGFRSGADALLVSELFKKVPNL